MNTKLKEIGREDLTWEQNVLQIFVSKDNVDFVLETFKSMNNVEDIKVLINPAEEYFIKRTI